jgi:hypothetical protein
MTISEIVEGLEQEQKMVAPANRVYPMDVSTLCSLTIELARHVSKLEQEIYKL